MQTEVFPGVPGSVEACTLRDQCLHGRLIRFACTIVTMYPKLLNMQHAPVYYKDMNGMVCDALVKFSCYQYRYE